MLAVDIDLANIGLFEVNNRNFRKRCEMCSKLRRTTPTKLPFKNIRKPTLWAKKNYSLFFFSFFCFFCILVVFFYVLKSKLYILTRLCGRVSDKNFFTWPISGNKATFFGLVTLSSKWIGLNESIPCFLPAGRSQVILPFSVMQHKQAEPRKFPKTSCNSRV